MNGMQESIQQKKRSLEGRSQPHNVQHKSGQTKAEREEVAIESRVAS
jgi:hypothetical protein